MSINLKYGKYYKINNIFNQNHFNIVCINISRKSVKTTLIYHNSHNKPQSCTTRIPCYLKPPPAIEFNVKPRALSYLHKGHSQETFNHTRNCTVILLYIRIPFHMNVKVQLNEVNRVYTQILHCAKCECGSMCLNQRSVHRIHTARALSELYVCARTIKTTPLLRPFSAQTWEGGWEFGGFDDVAVVRKHHTKEIFFLLLYIQEIEMKIL